MVNSRLLAAPRRQHPPHDTSHGGITASCSQTGDTTQPASPTTALCRCQDPAAGATPFPPYLVDIPEATPCPQGLATCPQPARVPPPQRRHRHRPDEAAASKQQVLHPAHQHRGHGLLRWVMNAAPPPGCPGAQGAGMPAGGLYRACGEPAPASQQNSSFTALPGQAPGMPRRRGASGCSSSAPPAAHTAALSS